MRWTGSKKNLKKSTSENVRKELVEKEERHIPLKRQAELLSVNRTSLYRKPLQKEWSDLDLYIMRLIDELHTAEPAWGYRTITSCLQQQYGLLINRKKVRRLMRIMGIYAIYPKPNLSKLYHAQYVKPYLLRNLPITRANQVWGIDITYVRMQKGFMYLFVIIDWYSRCIVDYELSSTLDKRFVIDCLTRALAKRRPEIINSDQGSHFTCPAYIDLLEEAGVKISMDGKGRCRDNARTERFFRSLKYERLYLNEYETPRQLRVMIREYIQTYNTVRPHSSLGGQTPIQYYPQHEDQKLRKGA